MLENSVIYFSGLFEFWLKIPCSQIYYVAYKILNFDSHASTSWALGFNAYTMMSGVHRTQDWTQCLVYARPSTLAPVPVEACWEQDI